MGNGPSIQGEQQVRYASWSLRLVRVKISEELQKSLMFQFYQNLLQREYIYDLLDPKQLFLFFR